MSGLFVRNSLSRAAVWAGFGALLLLLSASLLTNEAWAGLACLPFALASLGFGVWRLLDRRVQLEVGPEGLRARSISEDTLPWSRIASLYIPPRQRRGEFLHVDVFNPDGLRPQWPGRKAPGDPRRRGIGSYDYSLPFFVYDSDPEDVLRYARENAPVQWAHYPPEAGLLQSPSWEAENLRRHEAWREFAASKSHIFEAAVLRHRSPVWQAISRLWVDEEVTEADLQKMADSLRGSGYNVDELDRIYRVEVTPALSPQLANPTPPPFGYDPLNLELRVFAVVTRPFWRRALNVFRIGTSLLSRRWMRADWERVKSLVAEDRR